MSSQTSSRFRLTILGANKVGKTCIIRRYLNDSFSERYKETKDDIYSRDFSVRGSLLPLDIHDTNYKFPDIRKLSIKSASAFVLVLDLDNKDSLAKVEKLLMEVTELRPEYKTIPIVIVGNKVDIVEDRKVGSKDVLHMLAQNSWDSTMRYLETSAKENKNIAQVFQALLDMSGFPNHLQKQAVTDNGDNATSGSGALSLLAPAFQRNRNLSMRIRSSRSPSARATNDGALHADGEDDNASGFTRHGSLIRRTQRLSLKIKNFTANDDGTEEPECRIS